MEHKLKTHPAMFCAIRDGRKTFEIRKDDRAFQTGDILILEYHNPDVLACLMPPTGEDFSPIRMRITFVLRGGQYGLEPHYVGLALRPEPEN